MFLITILNILAFITLIILILGFINLFKKSYIENIKVCLFLKTLILLEILLIVISIYLPLSLQSPLEYSKFITAPVLIILILVSLFLLYSKKLSCYILFSIISLGIIGALFRIYSTFQLNLTSLI